DRTDVPISTARARASGEHAPDLSPIPDFRPTIELDTRLYWRSVPSVPTVAFGSQADAHTATNLLAFFWLEPFVFHGLTEALTGPDLLIVSVSPRLPRRPKSLADLPVGFFDNAALINPTLKAVFIVKIFLSGILDDLRWSQSNALPFEAAINRP